VQAERHGGGRARSSGRARFGRRRIGTLALAMLLACLCAGSGAGDATAIIVHLAAGRAISYEAVPGTRAPNAFDKLFSNVDYNGGPVMGSNTNYAFYWDPAGAPAYPADYAPGINGFLEDLAHDSGGHENVDSVAAQYNGNGAFAAYDAHFGGAILDTNPYPANGCAEAPICLSDSQIRSELSTYIKAKGLPADLAHEYFVLLPPGVESCFEGGCSAGTPHPGFCAYHSSQATAEGGVIVYANTPFLAGGICDSANHPNATSADGTISALSHEHDESITDPEPNTAWTDFATGETTGFEIADKCRVFEAAREFGAPLGTAPDGASYNQLINGDEYWIQQEWSNEGHACAQRLTPSSTASARFSSEYRAGTLVALDASASSAANGVVAYDWQFNDGSAGGLPVETASPTIEHQFPATGSWRVALTVFAADGTSSGYAAGVIAGPRTPPAVMKLSPTKGPAAGGTIVTIAGSHLGEATAVHFGTLLATSVTVVSAGRITAVSPAGTAGTLTVTVTTPQGTSPASAGAHFKLGPPTVTSVSPAGGPRTGGTLVSVGGTGFALGSGTRLRFATRRGTAVSCASITVCTVIAPAGEVPGAVDVVATVGTSTGRANPPADRFTYR